MELSCNHLPSFLSIKLNQGYPQKQHYTVNGGKTNHKRTREFVVPVYANRLPNIREGRSLKKHKVGEIIPLIGGMRALLAAFFMRLRTKV